MNSSSLNDSAVLNRILNPLLPAEIVDEEERAAISEKSDAEDVLPADESSQKLLDEAKGLEVNGVKLAEAGKLQDAVATFTRAIELMPKRPSPYNNRAQAYRLDGNIEAALADLNTAIDLSGKKGKAACQAFTQRGLIYRLQQRDEEAKADLEAATALGSMFAKNQLIMLNPYAAMCNKMIAEVIGKLQRGEPEDKPSPGKPA